LTRELEPEVVHLDSWLAVVDKPAGLVVHPAPGHHGPTLTGALAQILGGGQRGRPGIVHRLDRDTSGLMIVARTEAAHTHLTAQIRRRQVKRTYLALVEGRLGSRTGTIDAPLGRNPRRPTKRAVSGRGARPARTHFEAREALSSATLVEVTLETGRTHQIRAHFAAIGHPLCGDPTYGRRGTLGLERQFLHSHRLELEHPADGRRLSFSSPLPADLRLALEAARAA
jgi:23S rRNA pseudouridine1911/1915/1917 synthase